MGDDLENMRPDRDASRSELQRLLALLTAQISALRELRTFSRDVETRADSKSTTPELMRELENNRALLKTIADLQAKLRDRDVDC
jgi:hypothetical protein